MNTPQDFVNRLKSWRQKTQLSQGQAASLLGVTRSYLNQVENGRPPGAALVSKFNEVFAVHFPEPSSLVSEQPESTPGKQPSSQAPTELVIMATKLRSEAQAMRDMASRMEAEAARLEEIAKNANKTL